MPGAQELQLISRYFGGPAALRSLAGTGSKLAERATEGSSENTSGRAQLQIQKADSTTKKQSSTDDELMQVLFTKMKGSK